MQLDKEENSTAGFQMFKSSAWGLYIVHQAVELQSLPFRHLGHSLVTEDTI